MARCAILIAALVAYLPAAARADPPLPDLSPADRAAVADYNAILGQADAAWAKLPFTTRKVVLVARKAPVFGAYEPRIDASFRPGEAIFIYIEPIGYTFRPLGPEMYEFGVAADLAIVDAKGAVLFDKRNFASATLRSRAKAREFMLNYMINLNGAAPGSYDLVLTLHDAAAPARTTKIVQRVQILAAN